MITTRLATRQDVPFILEMIYELARYEAAEAEVRATEQSLTHWLIKSPAYECLIGSIDGVDQGIALFFTNFSTWEGAPGLYLEDLVVSEAARGKGLGTEFFRELSRLALARGYTRIEWSCLNWNEPSLAFYRCLGAIVKTEWLPLRLALPEIRALAGDV